MIKTEALGSKATVALAKASSRWDCFSSVESSWKLYPRPPVRKPIFVWARSTCCALLRDRLYHLPYVNSCMDHVMRGPPENWHETTYPSLPVSQIVPKGNMCGRFSIQLRIPDSNDCLIGDFGDSGAAGQISVQFCFLRNPAASTSPWATIDSTSCLWVASHKTARAVRGTIPLSQGWYVPRSSLASASICSCAFWGRSRSGFINWATGYAGERGLPLYHLK